MTEQQQYPTREQIAEAKRLVLNQPHDRGCDSLYDDGFGHRNRCDCWQGTVYAVLALFPQPTPSEVEVEGSFFAVADLPDILARHMRALDDANRREKQHWLEQHEQPTPSAEPSSSCPKCRHAAHADWCPNMASDNDCACTYDSNETPSAEPRGPWRYFWGDKPADWDESAPWDEAARGAELARSNAPTGAPWDSALTGGDLAAKPVSIAGMAPGTTFTAELTRYPGRPLRFARDHGPYVIVDGFNFINAEVDPSTIRDVTPPLA